MNRLVFLVDGFNVYHSVLRLRRDTDYSAKWLDLFSLCASYAYLFGKDARVESVHYFSAIPYHLSAQDPNRIERHQTYLTCLEDSGVQITLGRFKQKDVFCNNCRTVLLKHEEKETDVAIAITLMEVFFTKRCDTAVIVSGDTDLAPAVRKCQNLFPNGKVVFAFPYARKNKELATLAPGSFSMSAKQYIRYQFPNPVILKDGRQIHKPSTW
jgi:uncharacterized LabA/DUF88 family protein